MKFIKRHDSNCKVTLHDYTSANMYKSIIQLEIAYQLSRIADALESREPIFNKEGKK